MRVLFAVTALVVLAGVAGVSLEDLEFHSWKLKFGKNYGSAEEESQRKTTWLNNHKLVLEHNLLADQGLKSYRLGMNLFADMDNQEYQATFANCLQPFNGTSTRSATPVQEQAESTSVPDFVDWRKEGYVTGVKNQMTCGSCWAFSAVGGLEGQMFQKTGKLVPLSEQQLVDCSYDFGNNGCKGGFVKQALKYVISHGGLQSEESYRYENKAGKCKFYPENAIATCKDYEVVLSGDENALKKTVAEVGPVSVSINANRFTFQLYDSGVYDDPFCSNTLTHAVLAVGYNTDSDEKDYWVIKNSWGVNWGENGYIKMSRNRDNQCGIASRVVYPVV